MVEDVPVKQKTKGFNGMNLERFGSLGDGSRRVYRVDWLIKFIELGMFLVFVEFSEFIQLGGKKIDA
jgi:hypothetical protein